MDSVLSSYGGSRPRRKTADETFSNLSLWERRWRDRQRFLQSRGYILRPRYHPDWVPSWRIPDSNKVIAYCEDAIRAPVRLSAYVRLILKRKLY